MERLLCLLSGMNAGGAETFLMKIYRELDRDLYQMDFCINTFDKCFYEDEILSMGGKIYRIPSKSENRKEFECRLIKIIKSNKYKTVLRITSNAAGFMDLKIAKRAGALTTIARSSNSSDGGGLKVWMVHRLGRLLFGKYVDIKIAPSDLAAKYTFGENAYRKNEVHIIHNAIDLDVYKYDENARDRIRKELGIPLTTKVIGHVGRFNAQKNHGFLIDLFSEIHKKDSQIVLLLVGNGNLKESIQEKAESLGLSDYVIFTGIRSDVAEIYSAMDIFVFPSLYEGMPNTVIEAQATGLTCVISDTITKEADVTGLVKYLSLNEKPNTWSEVIMKSFQSNRISRKEEMRLAGYEIKDISKTFRTLVYKEDRGNEL